VLESYTLENQGLEAENHMFEEEDHLNQTFGFGFQSNISPT